MIDFARNDYGDEEYLAVKRVLDSGWLASGNENEELEKEFSEKIGRKYSVCVNSGSSANLLAMAALGLEKGSLVLTSACGFPATMAPILHLGLEPVLVDYDLETHNISIEEITKKIHKIKAIILAHTMGNPVEIDRIIDLAKKYNVKIIEDCCESIGSTYLGKQVGTFGDISTFSFYPSHQITAGGMGGMISTDDRLIWIKLKELRDWGKTWRWDEKLGDNKTMYDMDIGLSYPYYRHYCYSQVGYNMKLSEINAAFAREQLKKIDSFKNKRIKNYDKIVSGLSDIKHFQFMKVSENSIPNYFGVVITIKDGSPIRRNGFGDFLERRQIRHRPFFAGNITMHKPFFPPMPFPVADKLMKDSLFIGCHTKITDSDIDYIIKEIKGYADGFNS